MLRLEHGDCLEVMDGLIADGVKVDAIIADPPYNMNKAAWDCFASHADFLQFTYTWIDKAIALLKDDGNFMVFNTPFNSAYILRYLIDEGMHFRNWIVYNKKDGQGAAKRQFKSQQEVCLYFSKSNNHTFNFDSVRVPYDNPPRKQGIIKNGKRWFPNTDGKLCDDVWQLPAERNFNMIKGIKQKQDHPTPKPLAMIERLIKATTNKGDVVCDQFMGIGTTGIACKKLGRGFIGIELDKAYYDIAVERIDNVGIQKELYLLSLEQ